MANVRPPITVAEAAERLGVSVRTVNRWISIGELTPLHKLNGIRGPWLLDPGTVDDFAARRAEAAR